MQHFGALRRPVRFLASQLHNPPGSHAFLTARFDSSFSRPAKGGTLGAVALWSSLSWVVRRIDVFNLPRANAVELDD